MTCKTVFPMTDGNLTRRVRRPPSSVPRVCPRISVIVPVFHDTRLARCLAALDAQDLPDDDYEIIVVDNSSSGDGAVRNVVGHFERMRLLHEPRPGSYAARNRGLGVARGEVIAFTDADCIPAVDWLRRGLATLTEGEGCGLVGGAIELFSKDPERPTAVELYELSFSLNQRAYVEDRNYGATANLFALRRVFDRVGPFDRRLKSSGDKEWGQRAARNGFRAVYSPTTRVYHPARSSLRELMMKTARIVGGARDLSHLRRVARAGGPSLRLRLARRLHAVWSHPRLTNSVDRLRVSAVIGVLGVIQIFERIRLRSGGVSRR